MCYRISDVCSIQIYSPGNPLARRSSVISALLVIMVSAIPKILMMVYRLYTERKKIVRNHTDMDSVYMRRDYYSEPDRDWTYRGSI